MKKSLTRILSLVLVLVMMLGVMPMASADTPEAQNVTAPVTASKTTGVVPGDQVTLTINRPDAAKAEGYTPDGAWSWGVLSGITTTSPQAHVLVVTIPESAAGTSITCTASGITYKNSDPTKPDLVATASYTIEVEEAAELETITVTPSASTVEVGQKVTLTAAANEGAELGTLTWTVTSADGATATKTASGATCELTATKAGTLSVVASSGEVKSEAVTVTVTDAAFTVDVNPATLTLTLGANSTLTATVKTAAGATVENAAVVWTATGEAASVEASTGKVTASTTKTGSAVITATYTAEGKTYTDSCAVTVTGGTIKCDNYSGQISSATLTNTYQLVATFDDGNSATNATQDAALVDIVFERAYPTAGVIGNYTVSATGLVSGSGVGLITVRAIAYAKGTSVKLTEKIIMVSFYEYNDITVTMPDDKTTLDFGLLTDINEIGNLYTKMVAGYTQETGTVTMTGLTSGEGSLTGDNNYQPASGTTNLVGLGNMVFTVGTAGTADFLYDIAPTGYDVPLLKGKVTIKYDGVLADIEYSTTYTKKVTFLESDFYDFWKLAKKDSALSYVEFNISSSYPAFGTLYTSTTNTTSTYKATSSHKFYYGTVPTGSANKDLGSLTYVPLVSKLNTYDVTIPFTAYGTTKTDVVNGVVVIHLNEKTNDITSRGIFFGTTYDNRGTSTTTDDLTYADQMAEIFYEKSGGKTLDNVIFTLPAPEKATLYLKVPTGASGNTLVAQGTHLSDGDRLTVKAGTTLGIANSQIKNVALIPAAGFSGQLVVSFTGYAAGDNTGTACTITFDVQKKTASSVFTDVTAKNYSWASDSVDFLYYEGTAQGSNGKYNPAANITRRDFMLMLYRAFLAEDYGTFNVTTNFPDVVKGADAYSKEIYQAVGVAKYLGIAQGTNNRFNPTANITRQEAMVLIYRTLETINKDLRTESNVKLTSMKDYTKIGSWATTAINSLVSRGVIQGTNDYIKPTANITRAEMAAILHRVITY